ncbi:alpha/beta hydrolase [Ktedonospora formicarum]|uniref:Xaa-Pro dipeptidyl-peptidase-like domain-containing protein n=1 Tax=Ktedonospora formicarum TaxID=2778364 RepID=A0A8J3ICH7_9CHLR|nr:alpha/beta fold hydrolase [Ktedonospora formicarum]GHO50715.1 hypothetical protein KSX_88780 [Ktedonospora formicarum]
MQQRSIRFWSEDVECAGTLYLPETLSPAHTAPAVVLGHGTASVKEMHLPSFARHFVEAGLIALAIDYRFLGESGGEPRQTVNPRAQAEDMRNAMSWLEQQPEVDANRIGIWGTSAGGGVVLHVAALDQRVKAVVAQIPGISFWRYLTSAFPADATRLRDLWTEERRRLSQGEIPRRIKITAPAGEQSALGPGGLQWHERLEREIPTFHNEFTMLSLDHLANFDGGAFIDLIAPTLLLMIFADQDELIPLSVNQAYFERAGEPKQLLTYHGNHYAAYDEPEVHTFAAWAARDWFLKYL